MSDRIVRMIGVLGMLWSLGGVAAYLGHVGVFGGEPGPAMPTIVTAAFATSTFAGVIGSIGLALLHRWAAPVLWLGFAAALINWGWVFLYGRGGELALGLSVIVICFALAMIATKARRGPALPA